MEPFTGEIMLFGGNFAPRGWALCDGQLVNVSSNEALFSLLGTTYGGDGRTTFGLPDLRGRAPLHQGSGPGLTPRTLGSRGGSVEETLSQNQMPSHTHGLKASTDGATANTPANDKVLADTNAALYTAAAPDTGMNTTTGNSGSSQGHPNMMPYTVVNYCIALFGTYPSRN